MLKKKTVENYATLILKEELEEREAQRVAVESQLVGAQLRLDSLDEKIADLKAVLAAL